VRVRTRLRLVEAFDGVVAGCTCTFGAVTLDERV
jgi:hypothetical protein